MKLTKENVQRIEHFAKHCIKQLGIKGKVKITLSKHQTGMPTAGYFNPANCEVFVAVHNRAIADVMRTLSHELTHCRQQQQGIDFPFDDEGLQPLEDEANLMSGRLVRFWGRSHREIYADLISEGLEQFLYSNRSPKS
jgi:hypothetical protein